jgi:hypothetical protein
MQQGLYLAKYQLWLIKKHHDAASPASFLQVYFDKALYQCLHYKKVSSYTILMYRLWRKTRHHVAALSAGVL